ncbi:NAC domain-containing protein 90-like [Olea europaea var. sylvestris]|uniref:NAC domain-containing protein 90-like n=1 Tax=Olea europaea var. sylvestris TaxID=158386 RepID=UPI000C1D7E77|nr:NAC domain-containing protein 90-like [Olea europaea var. sylvestris]
MSENLLPGFRFYPTEEELISFYLLKKIQGKGQELDMVIPVVHIYDYSPWDLPQYAGELCRGDPEQWFFFFPKQEREARGGRPNRLTMEGYWKATGSPGDVYSSNGTIIGRKRTMVFYVGRAPNGTKTSWKMNEYKAIELGEASSSIQPQISEEFTLCRVYKQSKCIRSFDRRPSQAAEGGQPVMHHQHDHNNEGTTTVSDIFSGNISPSEDHAANSDNNWDNIMATGDGSLWDWEQVNKDWYD